MLGLLRTSVRSATTRPVHTSIRQLPAFRVMRTGSVPLPWTVRNSKPLYIPSCTRSFSLEAFKRKMFLGKPTPSPTPRVVAQITRLEAEANVHPHDVEKQLALFRALLDTGFKTSYDLIINRWEQMCEFDPSSPLLHSNKAFSIYVECLLLTDQEAAINAAIQRRDNLLAAHPLATVSDVISTKTETVDTSAPQFVQPESTSPETPGPVPVDPLASTSPQPQKLDHSSSAEIAQSVLAGKSAATSGSSSTIASPLARLKNSGVAAEGTPGAPIQVSIVERRGSWIPRLVRFIALTLIGSFFFLVILSVFFENTGFMKAGPRQLEFEPAEGKVVKFSDVHGVDEAKDELQDIVAFLKDPSAFASLGGKLPKGVLLTGPPGTGKTMLARAVAGEAGVPFFFASGSDFEEMFVGVGAKRVRDLFAAARRKEPAIIFIDELDAVGGKRSNRDQQYMKQTLNQLLVEMDGFQQNESIIVIAATNFPESLDQALVRPGRFDRIVAVPLPDIRGRVQILTHHMRGVTIGSDVDPQILARGTSGFSGADLANMINLAAIQASKEQAKEVELKHFEWAKDRIIMGAERKSQYIEQKEKLATAYHEGGHALVALYTDGAMPLHKVTCVPRGHALGFTAQLPENDRTSVNYKQFLATIDVSMGGRVAEELIYGHDGVTSGASSDIRKATATASAMVKEWGFSKLGPVYYDSKENLSQKRKQEIEDEISALVRGGETRAMQVLTSRMDELHRLAHALVEYETLTADEVRQVVKGEPIRHISEILEEEISKMDTSSEGSS